jgi:uncharacterized repeat protein (TIGR03803 family)
MRMRTFVCLSWVWLAPICAQAQWKAKVLHNFDGTAKGLYPVTNVVLDAAGNLYGAAAHGGFEWNGYDCGVFYKLDAAGHETVLHAFGGDTDGCYPQGVLTQDSSGNIYGTTPLRYGVLYKIDAHGRYAALYTFTSKSQGVGPNGSVAVDSAGNIYGVTHRGGPGQHPGNGVLYKLEVKGNYRIVHAFKGGADGAHPNSGVVMDSAGNLYGTTGGSTTWGTHKAFGSVFKVDPSGKFTVLHRFSGPADGRVPSGLILDPSGNLYGATRCCTGLQADPMARIRSDC